MKGWMLQDGDLVLGPEGFALVDGPAKVQQDLGVAAAEPYGSDQYHPRWGSLLDRYIGMADPDVAAMLTRSEINRIVNNYMAIQAYTLAQDARHGRTGRYGAGELVREVQRIDVMPAMDSLFVRVQVLTLSGTQVSLLGIVGV